MESVDRSMKAEAAFYRGKRIFITGHTGFKGSWLSFWLSQWGADVTGYALSPMAEPNLYSLAGIDKRVHSVIGDIRDLISLQRAFEACRPEIVIHLAAQPIVREGYKDPVTTYSTNVMGTVNLLECVRQSPTVKSFLNVTTDKVYQNNEWLWGYRETDCLDGQDPYANSKSCSELVTYSYRKSFFADKNIAISTARAGNVIGGGDFSVDRIVPDCVRAAMVKEPIQVRNPNSIRPYQHVLEPLYAYLTICQAQYEKPELAGAYNVGPDDTDCVRTAELAEMFCRAWGEGQTWETVDVGGPHEANLLKLDCAKIKAAFGWRPRWNAQMAIEKTVEWTKTWQAGKDITATMEKQIEEFIDGGLD